MSDVRKVVAREGARRVKLVVKNGDVLGREFFIEEGNNLIGRWDPDEAAFPEIDLEEEDVDAKISRKHAVVERLGSKLILEDIGSLNGTFINQGQRLEPGIKHELSVDDEIVVGKTALVVKVE